MGRILGCGHRSCTASKKVLFTGRIGVVGCMVGCLVLVVVVVDGNGELSTLCKPQGVVSRVKSARSCC